jgi:hypothetical protein
LLGIDLRWVVFCFFNLLPSYNCHISISVQYCLINSRALEKYVKQNGQCSANGIGALYNLPLNPVFLGKSGRTCRAIGKAGRIRHANNKNLQIFFICHALPLRGTKIAAPRVLMQSKEHRRIDKA